MRSLRDTESTYSIVAKIKEFWNASGARPRLGIIGIGAGEVVGLPSYLYFGLRGRDNIHVLSHNTFWKALTRIREVVNGDVKS